MKKIILLALLFPTFTYAVWWNPSTWNQKATTYEAVTPVTTPEPQIIETIVEVPVEKEVIKEVIREVPKIVEKIVTVQDQSVLAKNEELTKRVAELEKEIRVLQSRWDSCKMDLGNAEEQLDEKISKKVNQINDLKSKIAEIDLEIVKTGNGAYDSSFGGTTSGASDGRRVLIKKLQIERAELDYQLQKLVLTN